MITHAAALTEFSSPALLSGLLEEARLANPSNPHRVDQCIREAMMLLCVSDKKGSSGDGAERDQGVGMPSGLAAWQMRRVETHIAANLEGRLLVGDLAAVVRLSISYFIRAFKVTFGVTPCSYIMKQRVLRAKNIMLSTGRPLAEVALACGLADQAHFCRLFRRFEGQSPAAWRRRHAVEEYSSGTPAAATKTFSSPLPS
jgi:AraC-like DNA-binding protein